MTLEGTIRHGMSLSTECVSDVMVIAFGPIGTYINKSDYYTKAEIDGKGYLTEHQDISGKADKATTYTKSEVDTALSGKQATLVSGTNIKTINNQSLLGSGNINIQGGGGDMTNYYTKSETNSLLNAKQDTLTFDAVPTENSANPVFSAGLYSKFLYVEAELAEKANSADLASVATSGSYNDLSNKPSIPAAQVQSNWNESDTSSKAYIQNKPTIPTVPTNVSAFTNDAGYLTQHQSLANYYTKPEVNSAIVNFTPIIEDTRTSSVVAITGVAPFASLVDKQQILLHSKYMNSGSGAYTLNLTLSDNTTTGAKNIKYVSKTATWTNASGNMIRSGAYIHLIYDQTKDAWLLDLDYDTTYEAIGTAEINTGTATVGRLISAKILRDNFYTKSEIDTTIGNIETLLASI